MRKILNTKETIKAAKELHNKNKSIVLAGGFFDILHLGHIKFLENAKKQGDYLFVLLEDDKKAKMLKGSTRPVNSQQKRAEVLSSISSVDYVILLKDMTSNDQYDKLISYIVPDLITTTYGDPYIEHKKRQAKLVNGNVMCVMRRIKKYSTTKLANLI